MNIKERIATIVATAAMMLGKGSTAAQADIVSAAHVTHLPPHPTPSQLRAQIHQEGQDIHSAGAQIHHNTAQINADGAQIDADREHVRQDHVAIGTDYQRIHKDQILYDEARKSGDQGDIQHAEKLLHNDTHDLHVRLGESSEQKGQIVHDDSQVHKLEERDRRNKERLHSDFPIVNRDKKELQRQR